MEDKNLIGGDLLAHLLKLGNEAAKNDQYSLEGKNVAIKRDGDSWKVYYSMIPPPGKGVLGGDFTVMVDAKTLTVTKISKGR
jgi:hypothetical protein